jgi:hypothetical protein
MRKRILAAVATTLIALLAASALLSSTAAASASSATAKSSLTFTNYQIGATTVGESCPNSSAPCVNHASEPQIRADRAGNFYASSENGLGGGTQAWKSSDGGSHYATLVSPNQVSQTNTTGFAPGGGDTDVAVAPVANSFGFYNVYVASLSLANVDVSTSTDGGYQWSLNPTSATISGDDREWVAADGASKLCLSYHDVATFNIDVNCSSDAGATFTQLGDAIDTAHAYNINNNEIGNMAIDPSSHIIYQTFSGIDQSDLTACETTGCNYHVVYMGVSTDGGKTFTDYPVYDNPNTGVAYGHQFVNVSVDSAGNVYSVYSDNHNVSYSFSTNHGQTWSAPVQVNSAPSNTAVMPWSVAGDAGKLEIVWYGTSYYDGVNPPDSYPSSAAWSVYFAQNLSATQSGSSFTQVAASPINHYGGVCESGVSCTGNRDLYDDFGVAASPTTGLASIIYSDDQYDPSQPTLCTQSQSDTSSCDHTEIATQTGGAGIFAVAKHK